MKNATYPQVTLVVDETLYVRLKVRTRTHVINITNLLVFKVHSFAVNQLINELTQC